MCKIRKLDQKVADRVESQKNVFACRTPKNVWRHPISPPLRSPFRFLPPHVDTHSVGSRCTCASGHAVPPRGWLADDGASEKKTRRPALFPPRQPLSRLHCVCDNAPYSPSTSHTHTHTQPPHASTGPSLLAKLGRVLQEKAAADIERVFKGTSKTREKLGVSSLGRRGRRGRDKPCVGPTSSPPPSSFFTPQVVDELFAYWTLEKSEDALEELEEVLIAADFGPRAALAIVDGVRDDVRAGTAKTPADLKASLKRAVADALSPKNADGTPKSGELDLAAAGESEGPAVLMVVGVNGGGKTTTIGKLASRLARRGATVMMAAGDTFRAAAGEQLAGWATRAGVDMADAGDATRPDAVLYRAAADATARGADILLCDTSGRLHTNDNLMAELSKCGRSLGKARAGAPHETLLVLDGTTGLNMVNQAREFNNVVPLTGIVVTKLDGTARGGAVVGVVSELGVPIKFVGVGETVEDLQPFDAAAFVDALFPEDKA